MIVRSVGCVCHNSMVVNPKRNGPTSKDRMALAECFLQLLSINAIELSCHICVAIVT